MLEKLNQANYQAYLVGGGVRDLLLHKAPKDFDIATNATPSQIRSLFKNARIIGRRFKLVHILFHREIIEVATFRGNSSHKNNSLKNAQGMLVRDNVFGSLDEDAIRRDFTINSLYYCLSDRSIVDYTGGFKDIQNKQIRIIGDPVERYTEDPVRMLRAIRFSAKLDFSIEAETAKPLKGMSSLIKDVSHSRLFEEMSKLFQCGSAESVQSLMVEYGFFEHLFPQTHALWNDDTPIKAFLTFALQNTDRRILEGKPITPAFLFAVILWFPLLREAEVIRNQGEAPLPALEQAMSNVIRIQNKTVNIPKRFTLVMREIWLLQFRFDNRAGKRAWRTREHARFRAAYDFLALRALAGDAEMQLADWWTTFQDAPADEQKKMVQVINNNTPRKPRRRKPKPKKTS